MILDDIALATRKRIEAKKKEEEAAKAAEEQAKKDAEAAAAKAKAEAEKLAKQANMSELEKAQNEATEWQTKYNEAQSVIDLATQKDETRKKMAELGVDEKYLKYAESEDLETIISTAWNWHQNHLNGYN